MLRISPLIALAVAGTLALAPQSPAAGPQASHVAAPGAPFGPLTLEPPGRFQVTGTASFDPVDVRCVHRGPMGDLVTAPLAGGDAVTVGGGAFSHAMDLPPSRACRILALPPGPAPGDLASFSGPLFLGAERELSTVGGIGPNAALVKGFRVSSGAARMNLALADVASGGAPSELGPVDAGGQVPWHARSVWLAGAALRAQTDAAGETRSGVQIDGINAFSPGAAAALHPGSAGAPGLPGITVERLEVDPLTRDLELVTLEPFVTCGAAGVTASEADETSCPELHGAGVALRRTVVARPSSRSVEVRDRWLSTDGREHALDALYEHGHTAAGLPAQRFPWVGGGSWTARVAGDQVAPPAGRVATLFARGSPEPPQIPNHIEIPSYTQGSLTISPRPEAIRFTGDAQFEVAQRRTVPASGALGIEHRFTVGTTSAEVEAQAAEMEQRARAGLAIAITSATQVSGYDPSYVVSGVAVTSGGARSLLVNGQPVALRADGSWSASMQLAPGVNPLSATVTDHAGDGASANGSVTFTPGPSQSTILTGAVRKGVLNARLRCQTLPGASCAGRLKLTARVTRVKRTKRGRRNSTKTVTLATRAFSIRNGEGSAKPVRLGRTTRKIVRRYRIRRATLTLTQTVGGVTKATRTSIAVRL
jgi:hypothetical protein